VGCTRPARRLDFRIDGSCPSIVNAEATGGIHSHLQHGTVPDFEIDAAASILGCRLKTKRKQKTKIMSFYKHLVDFRLRIRFAMQGST
jgi:hypothetical protein